MTVIGPSYIEKANCLEIMIDTKIMNQSSMFQEVNQTTANQTANIVISNEAIFWLIIGILTSIVIGFLVRIFARYHLRPILSFDRVTTVENPSHTEIIAFVRNDGKSGAENCYGTVEISGVSDEEFKNTRELEVSPQFTQNLAGKARGIVIWKSPFPEIYQSLNRQEVRPMVIGRRRENRLELPSEGVWSPMACSLEPEEDVSLDVKVTAKNCKPIQFSIAINVSKLALSPTIS